MCVSVCVCTHIYGKISPKELVPEIKEANKSSMCKVGQQAGDPETT
jgi:hypothetical protein